MLTRVKLSNFKAIKQFDVYLKPLTVFVGENGTGKSSVLQSIAILKRSLGQSQILTDLPSQNLGLHTSLISNGEQSCKITLEGDVKLDSKHVLIKDAKFGCTVGFDYNGFNLYESWVEFIDKKITNKWERAGEGQIKPGILELPGVRFTLSFTNEIGYLFGLLAFATSTPTQADRQYLTDVQSELRKLSNVLVNILRDFYVVPPMRGLAEPFFSQSQPVGDYSLRAGTSNLGASLASNLLQWLDNMDTISEWEQRIVGAGVKVKVMPPYQVFIQNPKKQTDFVNEGFGSNQLLFTLERLVNSPANSVIAIEEPEIHLHPKASFELGYVLCEAISKFNKQVIVTTHDPNFISGIVSASMEKKLDPGQIALISFQRKDNAVEAVPSKIADDGTIEGPALQSFIESSIDQLKRLTK
ncbi:MAG: ATP-binding protein [Conexivisphaerales archaeon]